MADTFFVQKPRKGDEFMELRKCEQCNFYTLRWLEFNSWIIANGYAEKMKKSGKEIPSEMSCVRCLAIRVPPQFLPKVLENECDK